MDELMNKLRLISIDLELQASTSPQQFPFIALVTYGGRPSTHPVGGTEALNKGPLRVMIPQALLRQKIRELEGKKVFAATDLVSHSHSVDVGEFVSAWVESVDDSDGNLVVAAKASGFLSAAKEPELVRDIVSRARMNQMGFSYDLKDVKFTLSAVSSSKSSESEELLELADFKWRGATILRRDAAAYEFTQLAASKSQQRKDDTLVDKSEIIKAVTDSVGPLLERFTTEVFAPFKLQIEASVSSLSQDVEKLGQAQAELKASMATKPVVSQPVVTSEAQPEKISIKDLTAALTASLRETLADANKPVLEALGTIAANRREAEEEERPAFRKSLDGLTLTALAKYRIDEDDEPSVEKYCQLITSVQNDDNVPKAEKVKLLGVLGAAKRTLMRQSMKGGVQ